MELCPETTSVTDPLSPAIWLGRLAGALAADRPVAPLFTPDCYWRDRLAVTFTLATIEGRERVAAMLRERAGLVRFRDWRPTGAPVTDEFGLTEQWFDVDTALGPVVGAVRLRDGLCHHVYTALTGLTGHPEAAGRTRPLGVAHGARRDRTTWADARAAEIAASGEPYALVVGGGQGGLALSARLRAQRVPHLVVEAHPRAGDAWRSRYRTLVLHDPVWYDHMPYLPFPPTWPVFTPKDKMGDWLEAYADLMELPLWTSTTCRRAEWRGERWQVTVEREGREVTLSPTHLVFATGAYGPPREIAFPGADDFRGTLIHSHDYRGAEGWAGRDCVVIGAASSAHDVAADLWDAGAKVTMVQRSPTTVVRSETLMDLGFDIYSETALEAGIDVDRADHIAASMPMAEMAERQRRLYGTIRARDADFYRALEASGFLVDFGEDQSGLMMKAMRTGSGYYIDVGASDLIIRGEIAVVPGQGVARINREGLTLADGRSLRADLIVACLGYQSMHETVARIVDRQTADLVGRCWGLGSGVRGDPGPWHGEPLNMWKPVAHPKLWFHGGNLALSRYNSRFLALQLKARLEGLAPAVWDGALPAAADVRVA
jgi:putative flavoprotein involved in K+ transport